MAAVCICGLSRCSLSENHPRARSDYNEKAAYDSSVNPDPGFQSGREDSVDCRNRPPLYGEVTEAELSIVVYIPFSVTFWKVQPPSLPLTGEVGFYIDAD